MVDLLLDILSEFGYPVMLQGSMAQGKRYPDNFFTYWNNASDDTAFYNNAPHRIIWDYDINFYSIDPVKAEKVLLDAKIRLRSVGFLVSGNGSSIGSDEKTHVGRSLNVRYMENINV